MTQWLPGTTRNRIQDLCRDRNITQSELAQQVEIDKSTLSRFLNEKTNSLSEACIIRIAEYFKVSTDFLLGVTDIPDRKHYEIEELGLTIGAAKKLYLRKVDPAIVSQLIEHPRFNELTQQLALYQEGTLAAGLAAQEQMIQSMTEMLIQQATNYPEDKPAAAKTIQALQAYNRPFHAGERQAIQQNFQKIVRDMGPDGTKEREAKQLTKATMQQLTASLEKGKHSIDLHQVQAQQMITGIAQALSVLEVPEPLQPQMDAAKAQLMAGLQQFLNVLQQAKEMACWLKPCVSAFAKAMLKQAKPCSECSNRPFSGWQLLLQNVMYICHWKSMIMRRRAV